MHYQQLYFLYFEETDFLLRSKRKQFNTFLIPNLKIKHKRASSIKKSENIDLISLTHEYDSSKAEFCLACHCKTGKVFELIVPKNDKRKMKRLGLNQFDLHFYQ